MMDKKQIQQEIIVTNEGINRVLQNIDFSMIYTDFCFKETF